MIADKEYPTRVAFSMLNKAFDDLLQQFALSDIATAQRPLPYAGLASLLSRFQDPHAADSLLKVQRDLDETKIILVRRRAECASTACADAHSWLCPGAAAQRKTIESTLERGEKIENLVERTNELSSQSKMFYRQARKANQCCVLL